MFNKELLMAGGGGGVSSVVRDAYFVKDADPLAYLMFYTHFGTLPKKPSLGSHPDGSKLVYTHSVPILASYAFEGSFYAYSNAIIIIESLTTYNITLRYKNNAVDTNISEMPFGTYTFVGYVG